MTRFRDKLVRVLTTPGMLSCYVRWSIRQFGIPPGRQLPTGAIIRGFGNFSEYWGAKELIPSASEIAFISKYAGKRGALIDIGANLGYLSFSMSALRPTSEVHSFEPSPTNFVLLSKNIELNGATNIRPHLIALSNEPGTARFLANPHSPTTNRLTTDAESKANVGIDVEVNTLDQFVEQRAIREIAFLKIDVEGFEPEVLKGAHRILSRGRFKAGMIELCPDNLETCGNSIEALLGTVRGANCKLMVICPDGSLGQEIDVQFAKNVELTNAALVPA